MGEEFFSTGFVIGTHGLDGTLKVRTFSGETEHLLKLKKISLQLGDKIHVFPPVSIRIAANYVLLRLEGIDTVEKAAEFRQALLVVSREEACPLKEGEFYVEDLKGCGLFCHIDGEGEFLAARVLDVIDGGGGFLLEVMPDGDFCARFLPGSEVKPCFVPFNKHFCGKVEIEASRIELLNFGILE